MLSTFNSIRSLVEATLFALVLSVGLTGCGSLHSTETAAGRSEGLTASQHIEVGDKTIGITPLPSQVMETDQASIFSQFPFTLISTKFGSYASSKDLEARDVEVTADGVTVRIGTFSAKSSPVLAAIAAELESLAKWSEALAKAQAARDEAQAEVATAAIQASIRALVKIVLGL